MADIGFGDIVDYVQDKAPRIGMQLGLKAAYNKAHNAPALTKSDIHQLVLPGDYETGNTSGVDIRDNGASYDISAKKTRGTIAGDVIHAIKTIKDDPTNDKKKFLASTALATTLGILATKKTLSAMGRTKFSPEAVTRFAKQDILTHIKDPKALLEAGSALATVGGAGYAAMNHGDDKKVRRGLGVSAIGAGILGGSTYRNARNAGVPLGRALGRTAEGLSYAGGIGSALAMGTYGQRLADRDYKSEVLHGLKDEDTQFNLEAMSRVNRARGLTSRLPVTRYLPIGGIKDRFDDLASRQIMKEPVKGLKNLSKDDIQMVTKARLQSVIDAYKQEHGEPSMAVLQKLTKETVDEVNKALNR